MPTAPPLPQLPYWATQDDGEIHVSTLAQALIVSERIPSYLLSEFRVTIDSPAEAERAQRLTNLLC